MAGLNFGQIVEAALSGGLQGYAKQKQINSENELAGRKVQNEQNATALKADEQGFGVDPSGGLTIRSDYYTPGTPDYERGTRAAQLRAAGHGGGRGSGQGLSLEDAVAARAALQSGQVPAGKGSVMLYPGFQNMIAPPKPAAGVDPQLLEDVGYLPPGSAAKYKGVIPTGAVSALRPQKPDKSAGTWGEVFSNAGVPLPPELAAKKDEPYPIGLVPAAPRPSKPIAPKPSKALDSLGKKYSDAYADYTMKGGSDALQQNIDTLNSLASRLEQHGYGLGDKAIGILPKGMRDTFDPELADIQDTYQKQILPTLKSSFGARVTNFDAKSALETAYNPRLDPKANAKRIRDLSGKLALEADVRKQLADHIEAGGDPAAFKPKLPRSALYDKEETNDDVNTGDPVDPNAVRAKAAAKGGVGVNGAVMPAKVIDQIRAMPDKGTLGAPQKGARREVPDPQSPGKRMRLVFDGKRWNEE